MSSTTHHHHLRGGWGLQEATLLQHVRVHGRDVQACCHQVERPASGQRRQRTGVRLHWGAQALCNICAKATTSTQSVLAAAKSYPSAVVAFKAFIDAQDIVPRFGASQQCTEWAQVSLLAHVSMVNAPCPCRVETMGFAGCCAARPEAARLSATAFRHAATSMILACRAHA